MTFCYPIVPYTNYIFRGITTFHTPRGSSLIRDSHTRYEGLITEHRPHSLWLNLPAANSIED